MIILFLDDNPARHAIMDRQFPDDLILHTYDIDSFRAALEAHEKFDMVSLDHDLNEYTEDGHQSLLWDGGNATGLDACGYMVKYRDKLPDEIIIHSTNTNGAYAMIGFLESKGIKVRRQLFPDYKTIDYEAKAYLQSLKDEE
jgi:hypothetical protein